MATSSNLNLVKMMKDVEAALLIKLKKKKRRLKTRLNTEGLVIKLEIVPSLIL